MSGKKSKEKRAATDAQIREKCKETNSAVAMIFKILPHIDVEYLEVSIRSLEDSAREHARAAQLSPVTPDIEIGHAKQDRNQANLLRQVVNLARSVKPVEADNVKRVH